MSGEPLPPAPAGASERGAALRSGPWAVVAAAAILLAGNVDVAGFALPLGALLALAWANATGTPMRELGFARPGRWPVAIAAGIALGLASKLVMKAIVMPLLGAEPVNQAYHWLAGNRAALPGAVFTMIVGAGFGEEVVFRGFAFERLRAWLGAGRRGRALAVLLTSVGFGLAHLPGQGLPGAEQATLTGLLFGTIYAATGSLAVPMIAHAAFDLTAVAIIYAGLETKVAHLVLR